MPIEFNNQVASLSETVTVEEAERLASLVHDNPGLELDLHNCTHLHASVLQVLMVLKPPIQQWPLEADLTLWLRAALQETEEKQNG